MKTGVKVSIDNDKKLIVSIKKGDLAISSANARPEVFSPGNALDAKITDLDLEKRKIKLSVKAAQIDEEKSLIAKFGEGATKSGATLKGIFEKAIGRKEKKSKLCKYLKGLGKTCKRCPVRTEVNSSVPCQDQESSCLKMK